MAEPVAVATLRESGSIDRDGVEISYAVYGDGPTTLLLMPTWTIVHSRIWKGQLGYLARHFRVIVFDGRGNGASARPRGPEAYRDDEYAADAAAVMDATATAQAVVVGLSWGVTWALHLAASHPERVLGVVGIGASGDIRVERPRRVAIGWEAPTDGGDGWSMYNREFWLTGGYDAFVDFFFARMFTEKHSTKQIEDAVGWAHETTPQTLADATAGMHGYLGVPVVPLEDVCAAVRGPVLLIHGTRDEISPPAVSRRIAELTGGEVVLLEGSGHGPLARDPVRVNHLIRDFAERVGAHRPVPPTWTRAPRRRRRALYLSSPIGLGHARRDLAIARELRELHPDLEITWLAQHPVTAVLEEAGERVHPASAFLANESRHIEHEAGEHDLHAFQAIRRMDEILVHNFMVFDDVVREEDFDLVIGDEAWDVDHHLHENPELKRFAFAWMTDFVGWLPMPDGGSREQALTADYNAEMIEQRARFRHVRDRSIFVGSPDDVVPDSFGPGLPLIRDWVQENFDFAGYVTGFDPAEVADRERTPRGARLRAGRAVVRRRGRRFRRGRAAAASRARRRTARAAWGLRSPLRRRGGAAHRSGFSSASTRRDREGARPRALPPSGRRRPRCRARRPDDLHGAHRQQDAIPLRAVAAPLRAELPRAASAGAVPCGRTAAVRAGR